MVAEWGTEAVMGGRVKNREKEREKEKEKERKKEKDNKWRVNCSRLISGQLIVSCNLRLRLDYLDG